MRKLLAEYATVAALGRAPEMIYPRVAAHLATCAACRADMEELLALTEASFAGQVAAAPGYPPVDLSFLSMPAPTAPQRPWFTDALGRLTVLFSEPLLKLLRPPALAGATRTAQEQLLYRYVQEPGSLQDLDVTIEAYIVDPARGLGRVRVGVDVPSRGPLDQAGSQVVLRAGDAIWQDETDELGSVDFAPFPLESLPRLRVEITPLRDAEG